MSGEEKVRGIKYVARETAGGGGGWRSEAYVCDRGPGRRGRAVRTKHNVLLDGEEDGANRPNDDNNDTKVYLCNEVWSSEITDGDGDKVEAGKPRLVT